jgi:hypothetical protein
MKQRLQKSFFASPHKAVLCVSPDKKGYKFDAEMTLAIISAKSA